MSGKIQKQGQKDIGCRCRKENYCRPTTSHHPTPHDHSNTVDVLYSSSSSSPCHHILSSQWLKETSWHLSITKWKDSKNSKPRFWQVSHWSSLVSGNQGQIRCRESGKNKWWKGPSTECPKICSSQDIWPSGRKARALHCGETHLLSQADGLLWCKLRQDLVPEITTWHGPLTVGTPGLLHVISNSLIIVDTKKLVFITALPGPTLPTRCGVVLPVTALQPLPKADTRWKRVPQSAPWPNWSSATVWWVSRCVTVGRR